MVFSFTNVLSALVFLALGILCLAVFRRFIYPVLSARHERAKVTLTQKRDPAKVTRVIYVIGLLVFPVLGFLLGGMLNW
ncbi:hypothetical protein [Taklimakanibacter lacteus]|uniref:hypothetical protein n=1 Tax=Taklimakanibacter lacteus TaxID=2268456 RepID=UPI000E670779